MMTKTTLTLAALALAFVPATSQADDVTDFVKRLKGNVKSEAKSRFSSSSSNRGSSSTNASSKTSRPSSSTSVKTRSLSYSSGSVPTSVRRAASQNKVGLNSSRGGGARLSYAVDSQSKISRDDILFRKGSTEFADRYSREIVRDLACAMQDPALQGMQFVIEGHASADGSYGKNLDLSQRRAERIISEMIRLGVDPYSLIAVGYGESEAIYDSYSPETLLSQDRKVVVYRMD
ncbi:OmpA family protein [Verrucomicrobiales bacterium]|nr:OmpA family protein [bacterium]MDB4617636.1 OmpA family protein [Verrucomicrobiales bacterium]MDB4657695.1 OmpA family protein [Verrucomicrobiales bacterium]MDB4662747.1 OmpA family protein [Verrucomicrobiales bacterium]